MSELVMLGSGDAGKGMAIAHAHQGRFLRVHRMLMVSLDQLHGVLAVHVHRKEALYRSVFRYRLIWPGRNSDCYRAPDMGWQDA